MLSHVNTVPSQPAASWQESLLVGLVADGQVGRVPAENQSKFAGPHAHVPHLWEDRGTGERSKVRQCLQGLEEKGGAQGWCPAALSGSYDLGGSGLPLGDSSFSGLGGNRETVTGATSSRQSLPTTEPGDSGPAGARKEESSPPRVS